MIASLVPVCCVTCIQLYCLMLLGLKLYAALQRIRLHYGSLVIIIIIVHHCIRMMRQATNRRNRAWAMFDFVCQFSSVFL